MKILRTILFLFLLFISSVPAFAFDGWMYRVPVQVSNFGNESQLTNHQVLVVFNTAQFILEGKMKVDGSDIRFLDTDDQTILDYWIESGINEKSTKIWVKIPLLPDKTKKLIYLYYGNPAAPAMSNMKNTMISGEVGQVTVSSSYTTVNLSGKYISPVVAASYLEGSDNEEVSVRVRNVNPNTIPNTFQIKLHHPPGGISFNANTAYYVVVEEGQFETLNGVRIEAHKYNESNVLYKGGGSTTQLNFSHTYTSFPVVFLQVMTDTDTNWVTEALREIKTNFARVAMELAETGTSHGPETIGWIAMESVKTGAINNILFETTATGANVPGHDNGNYSTTFKQNFNSAPLVVADMRSRQEDDGGWAAIESISKTILTQHIEEDRVQDQERSHIKEDASILAFDRAGDLVFRKYARTQPSTEVLYPITKLVFINEPRSIFVNEVSRPITVQTQNQFDIAHNPLKDTTIKLSSTSQGGTFSLTDSPFIPVTEVTIPTTRPVAIFYYRDTIVGTPTITASAPSETWIPAAQQVSVGDVLLRGAYRVPITINNFCGQTLKNHQVLVTFNTETPIAQGKMKSQGEDIRFLDEDKSTSLNHWIESGINKPATKIWVKVPEIPVSPPKTIYLYYGNPDAVSTSDPRSTMVVGEIGEVTPQAGFTTARFSSTYTSPVVVASYEERKDNALPTAVRVSNVQPTTFQAKLDNPSGGNSDSAAIYYFAIEEGRHSTLDGILVEAHKYTATNTVGRNSIDNTWGNISFEHDFASPPDLFTQVMTTNDSAQPAWVTEAVQTITTDGAQSAMELAEVEANQGDRDHADETIGWVAIENDKKGTMQGIPFEIKTAFGIQGHTDQESPINFSQTFKESPLVIADLRTRNSDDGGWAAIRRKSTANIFLHVEEDNVFDPERSHPAEDVNFMAFGSHSSLFFRAYVCADQPTTSNGSEETVVFKLVFTTNEQTIAQNQVSSVMTVQTQSIKGSPQNVEEDTVVTLSSSSSSGEFSDSSSFFTTITRMTIPKGKNTIEFYYRDSQVGTPTIKIAESPSQEWEDAQQDVSVIDPVTQFLVEASSPQIAGQEFKVKVTALDEDHNLAPFYQGVVNLSVHYITPSVGTKNLSIPTLTNFVNGAAEVTNETYPDCGTVSIAAARADDSSKTGISNPVYFAPADFLLELENLNLENPPEHTVSQAFGLNITARNTAGEVCGNYSGPASLEVIGVNPLGDQGGVISPAELTFSDFKAGQAELTNAAYNKWGEIKISCLDDTVPAQRGTSENIMFLPKDFLLVTSEPKPLRTFFYLNEPFRLTVTARDFENSAVSNYLGTIQLTAAGFNLPGEYTFTTEDNGLHSLEDVFGTLDIEKGVITSKDKTYPQVTGKSNPLNVKEASIQVFSNQGPVGNLAISAAVIDKEGNIITEDNSTLVTLEFDEFIEDGSVTSTTSQPVTVKEGRATIIINDSQAEEVIVIPRSDPILNPISGVAAFGTAAKTGVGIQMYRELKE